jgi:phosphoglycolate phosphatase-like HAD superfamily hydrolase
MRRHKVALFDVDGTLVGTDGAGVRAIRRAFEEVAGVADPFRNIVMAGNTDPRIVKEAMSSLRLEINDLAVSEILQRYLTYLYEELSKTKNIHLKPGFPQLLQRLEERGVHIGLLTGNIEEGALAKLRLLNVDRFFAFGGFATDHEDRNMLLPIALKKLNALKSADFKGQDSIVIGDTPRDVACALPHRATALAVATGPYQRQTLEAAGAHWVLDDLGDVERALNIIAPIEK